MKKGNSPAMNQVIKLFKHTRSGSHATRARYLNSCRTFVNFLDEKFKLKNLRNLQDKHIVAFVQQRQLEGIADKTIKNDLGAIRYLHDLLPDAKYELSSNQQLQREYDIYLDKTIAVSGDRAWTNEEYLKMQQFLQAQNSPLAALTSDVMVLARSMGLRISEAVCMRRSQAESALRTGIYQVKGEAKNGLHREVPLSPTARELLEKRLPDVERGERVFVSKGSKAHEIVNRLEKYLERHRTAVTSAEGLTRRLNVKGEVNPLTFHGLRYNYVQDRMQQEQQKGRSWEQAAAIVTKEVGHGRIDVIKIYTNGK